MGTSGSAGKKARARCARNARLPPLLARLWEDFRMRLFDLKGKVAIVTGSSRGIGQSIAENLAEAGARVVVSSRKAASCEPVAEGIRKKGGEAIVIPASISDKAQLQNLVDETRKRLGPIDVLVCN